jgi:hypothetical protein
MSFVRTDAEKRLDKGDLTMDVATLAQLLRETSEHHDLYEKTHPKHDWWDWYAPYLSAREQGSTPEEASNAAGLYMEGLADAASR